MNSFIKPAAIAASALLALSGCAAGTTATSEEGATTEATNVVESSTLCTTALGSSSTLSDASSANAQIHFTDSDLEYDESSIQELVLNGQSQTISAVGVYRLTGEIADGKITVDAAGNGSVVLILDGINIANSSGSAIEILAAPEVLIVLADGSENYLSDTTAYDENEDQNAALFSKANLTIAGNGALEVNGNALDGIASKDGLVIVSGDITVNAKDDAIRGKDYLVIAGGTFDLSAGGDGLKSDNDETSSLGFIEISGGSFTIDAALDGIQGTSDVLISDGVIGLSAGDDAINAGCVIALAGGDVTLAATDDGMHSDAEMLISGGKLTVTESYEGIEAAGMYLSGGDVSITSSDDGINIAGGTGSTEGQMMRGNETTQTTESEDAFSSEIANLLEFTGGNYYVNASGDGIDVNGTWNHSGGVAVVHGPTENMNGALDAEVFNVSGGVILATGSSGMLVAPDTSSAQSALVFVTDIATGAAAEITDSSGNVIYTFTTSAKSMQSLVFTSSDVKAGETYTLSVNDQELATAVAGEYTTMGFGGGMGGERPEAGERPQRGQKPGTQP